MSKAVAKTTGAGAEKKTDLRGTLEWLKSEGDLIESLKKAFMLKMQKEIFVTKMELEKFKATAKDANTRRTIETLQKEVGRLQDYINKLADVEIPK